MVIEVDLTRNGVFEGMLAVTTSENVPGKGNNDIIHIARVKLSHPWDPQNKSNSSEGCLYKKVIAITSEGAEFVWKDETVTPEITRNARQYGSSFSPPKHWGQKEWEAMFGNR